MAYYPPYNPYAVNMQQPQMMYQTPMYQQPIIQQQQPQPTQATPSFTGEIVDGEEMVRATKIPVGGYGVFPKGDLSEIYVKTWNNMGTTEVISYQPVKIPEVAVASQPVVDAQQDYNILLQKIDEMNNKLEQVLGQNNKSQVTIFKDAGKDETK